MGRRRFSAWLNFGLCVVLVLAVGCASSPDSKDAPTSGVVSGAEPLPDPSPSETESDRVLTYPAEPLLAGRNSSSGDDATLVSFTVPKGWWGEQSSSTGWTIRWGESPEDTRASLWVDELEMPFEEAVARFKKVRNFDAGRPKEMTVNGRRTLLFAGEVTRGRHALLDQALDIGVDVVGWFPTRQAFVDLGTHALLVRLEFPQGERYLPDALRLLKSFRFGR